MKTNYFKTRNFFTKLFVVFALVLSVGFAKYSFDASAASVHADSTTNGSIIGGVVANGSNTNITGANIYLYNGSSTGTYISTSTGFAFLNIASGNYILSMDLPYGYNGQNIYNISKPDDAGTTINDFNLTECGGLNQPVCNNYNCKDYFCANGCQGGGLSASNGICITKYSDQYRDLQVYYGILSPKRFYSTGDTVHWAFDIYNKGTGLINNIYAKYTFPSEMQIVSRAYTSTIQQTGLISGFDNNMFIYSGIVLGSGDNIKIDMYAKINNSASGFVINNFDMGTGVSIESGTKLVYVGQQMMNTGTINTGTSNTGINNTGINSTGSTNSGTIATGTMTNSGIINTGIYIGSSLETGNLINTGSLSGLFFQKILYSGEYRAPYTEYNQSVSWRLAVYNRSNTTISNAMIVDYLPIGLTYGGYYSSNLSGSSGSVGIQGNNIYFSGITINPGDYILINVYTLANSNYSDTMTNNATLGTGSSMNDFKSFVSANTNVTLCGGKNEAICKKNNTNACNPGLVNNGGTCILPSNNGGGGGGGTYNPKQYYCRGGNLQMYLSANEVASGDIAGVCYTNTISVNNTTPTVVTNTYQGPKIINLNALNNYYNNVPTSLISNHMIDNQQDNGVALPATGVSVFDAKENIR